MPTIEAVSSKSDAQRAIIASYLCENRPKVIIKDKSEDIQASIDCMKAFIKGKLGLYCKESATTFRILIPIMGALGRDANFFPEPGLSARTLSPMYEELKRHNMQLSDQGASPFRVSGQLRAGKFNISGQVSSQFISGLLFATPLLDDDSEIHIDGKLESKSYVDMTLKVLEEFSIDIQKTDYGFFVPGGQSYQRQEPYIVEGDWSNASYFLVAGAFLDKGIRVSGLNMDSAQGDKQILDILEQMGAKIKITDDYIQVKKAKLNSIDLDASNVIDLVPIVSILASQAEGKTHIYNGARLRLKESDRIHSTVHTLESFGVETDEHEDGLSIYGSLGQGLDGNYFDSFGDHRIAMAVSIGSIIANDKVHLTNPQVVAKSYPNFYEDLRSLGLDDNLQVEMD